MVRYLVVAATFGVACASPTEGLDAPDAGPRGGGRRDAGRLDAGPRDGGGASDSGVDAGNIQRDAGARDAGGCSPGLPLLFTNPDDAVVFEDTTTEEIAPLTNQGAGELTLFTAWIEPDPGTAIGELTIANCENEPCPLNVTLCEGDTYRLPIRYRNSDASEMDSGGLHVRTNLGPDHVHVIDLLVPDARCSFPFPEAIIQVRTATPTIGLPVDVSGAMSLPGGPPGSEIVRWDWTFLYAPFPEPSFDPPGQAVTSFTPERSGVYFLGLDVQNNCGGAQSQGTEMITVL